MSISEYVGTTMAETLERPELAPERPTSKKSQEEPPLSRTVQNSEGPHLTVWASHQVPGASLGPLMDIAQEHVDGTVLLTKRTNLQLRGIQHQDGCVSPALFEALTTAGFLPSPSHELVRNIMVSPMTGRLGGRADLRSVAVELDRRLCAEPTLARLAGRFLFVLDEGRGDVGHRTLDLGVTAVNSESVQLRLGSHHWGPVVPLDEAAEMLIAYASRFLAEAGTGETALWHVDELPGEGTELTDLETW